MLINLITVWKEGVLPDIISENKNELQPWVAQNSFQFDIPPQVIFLKDLNTKTEATYYGDLPTVELQPDEQKIYDQTLIKLKENSKYNGKQMLLTDAIYDTVNNILYLEAVRVDYAFLVALENMKEINAKNSQLHHKDFFKTGVLAPFISKDNNVSIITRKDARKLNSVAAGFLECDNEDHPLSHLITETATKEANEEFVFDETKQSRLDFVGSPTITSISFRNAVNIKIAPTIEFIAPIQIKQDADFILSVMNNNKAPHAHEHVPGSTQKVSVDSDKREMASEFTRKKLPGNFLYGPVLHACAIQANPGMLFAPRMSDIANSRFYPIGLFKATPQKALKDYAEIEVIEQVKSKTI